MDKDNLVTIKKKLFSHERTAVEGVKVPKKKPKAGSGTDKIKEVKGKSPVTKLRSRLKTSPSAAGTSIVKEPKKKPKVKNAAAKVAIAKGKTTKTKDESVATKTKGEKAVTKTKDEKAATKTKDEKAATKTKDEKAATKTKDEKAATKTKDETDINATAGASRIKIAKKKPIAEKKSDETEKTKLKLIDEVYEAIITVGNARKGASAIAIKNYVINKREEGNEGSRRKHLNNRINAVLRHALENGELRRPADLKEKAREVSAVGRFTLPNKVVKPKNSNKAHPRKLVIANLQN